MLGKQTYNIERLLDLDAYGIIDTGIQSWAVINKMNTISNNNQ